MTTQVTQHMDFVVCGKCGTPFGVQENMLEELRASGRSFYCPNGHVSCYTVTTVQKLERQLAAERAAHDQTRQRAADLEAARAKIEKAHLRLTKNGVCPHCKRNFTNVARHMKSKHPSAVAS